MTQTQALPEAIASEAPAPTVVAPDTTSPAHELQRKLDEAQAALDESRRTIERAKAERELTRAAFDAGAIDLDAVAALADKATAVEQGLTPLDAIKRLRAEKPHLFRSGLRWAPSSPSVPASPHLSRRTGPIPGSMAGRIDDDPGAQLARAAQVATSGGDRASLMTYLRLRRAAV
jgi:hypothetical protein